jgi:hypothetical protein
MPTCFTQPIHDGKPGFGVREYAESLLCQFGAFIMNRDDDRSTIGRVPKLEDDAYHHEQRKMALQRILRGPIREEYEDRIKAIEEHQTEERQRNERLNAFRKKIASVNPPSDPELARLHELMVEQLFKTDTTGIGEGYWSKQRVPTFEDWARESMEIAHREAAYHTQQIREIAERNRKRLDWARRACEWIDTLPSGKSTAEGASDGA